MDRQSLARRAPALLGALALLTALALSIGLVGPAPTALAEQHLQTGFIFEADDFSQRDIWPTGSTDDFVVEYVGQTFRIQNNFFSSYVSAVRGFQADVLVETLAERVGGPAGSYYGAVCRWQNIHNYYALVAFGDSRSGIARIQNGVVEFLVVGTLTPEQFNPRESNWIGGVCEGSTLTLMINGQQVLQAQDAAFPSGAAGMMAGTIGTPGLDIRFHQIVVASPAALTAVRPGLIPQTGADELIYVVQPTDTLSEIAFAHNTTVADLLQRNPGIVNPNIIFPGQRLVVPDPARTPPILPGPPPIIPTPIPPTPVPPTPVGPTPTPAATPTPVAEAPVPPVFFIPETGPDERLYTVQSGDILTEIAAEFGVTVESILERNLHIIHPNILIPGQRLAIPLTGAPPAAPPAEPAALVDPETVIYQDDFSQSELWFTLDDDSFTAEYEDGVYQIINNQESSFFSSVRSFDYSDIHVEANAVHTAGPESGYFGVVCRWQDINNYYAFVTRGDGLYAILRIQDGQVYFLHSALEAQFDPTAANSLRGSCLGPTLTLSLNGDPILAVQDQAFESGYVGVMVGTLPDPGIEVQFTGFALLSP